MKTITHPYTFKRFAAVGDWLDYCRPWLERHEAVNNLTLGLAAAMASFGGNYHPLCLAGEAADGRLLITGLQTEPVRSLILAAEPELPALAYADFARYLADIADLQLPGLVGPRAAVLALADAWASLRGRQWRILMEQWIYQLDRVVPPVNPAPGRLRLATNQDLSLVTAWIEAFNLEALGKSGADDPAQVARTKIDAREIYLWEDEQPVSMAASARPSRHGITVNYVYTPPACRGRGYAGSCVAQLSQRLLDNGYRFCTLFTDANYAVSNRIYLRIGYRPVEEFAMLGFD